MRDNIFIILLIHKIEYTCNYISLIIIYQVSCVLCNYIYIHLYGFKIRNLKLIL